MIYDLYLAYIDLINGSEIDYSQVIKEKYPQLNFDNIFYTTKTSEVK